MLLSGLLGVELSILSGFATASTRRTTPLSTTFIDVHFFYDGPENGQVRNRADRATFLNRTVNQTRGVNGETGEFARLREGNGLNQHG